MRPTDENQAASTRPNLMSSRRAAGEENILAMLERDSARRVGGRMSSPRLAWYCVAAAFVGILVGVVAWLAYDNHATATALQAEAERAAEAAAAPAMPPVPPEVRPPEPAPIQLAEAPNAALIVDQPQDKPASVPPLVMLPPDESGAAKPAATVKETPAAPQEEAAIVAKTAPKVEPKAEPKAEPKPAPAPKTARTEPARKAEKTEKPASAAKTAKADKMDKAERTEKAARPASRPAKAPAQRAVADKSGARKQKSAAGGAAEPAVDSDVALISAIIAQSERHRGEREKAAPCTGAKCPAPPSRP